jgi:hypothetical protein
MLSEGREKQRGGCAAVLFVAGFSILAFIGGWVVAATLFGWLT